MGVQGFKGLGWFLCGVVVAPACYLVNSHGAAEQAKLNATKLAILQAQRDIRGLETEFNTRANLAQLERWNGEVLALAAPAPQQYLAGEMALASLDQQPAEVQLAALVVPAGAPALQTASQVVVPAAVPVQGEPQTATPGKSVAQQDQELRKLMKKADRQAIASVDRGVLSAGTIDDLQKLAKREKLALR
ncbi:hypothetical protein Q9Q95_11580 [Sphingomonas sp. DG1-23]|jgi:hypothetical protein|uniref:hypothetical protein n=1 Tax=Sphingomonas sp. DG1-23 TaxID=3068316 RepID=UPI00273FCCED|nr:hypothetical protein [Sphingomonas sp. DG1-23]MDP5279562.1 hypothetical protein [Sphingomonas sp. DG1-23]